MHYWAFRLTLYRHHLAVWLTSIKQAAAGLVYLFPMALPALFMLPLLALGVMADAQTSPSQYTTVMWGYLLLTHSWITLQKDGILAIPLCHFDNMLPVSTARRRVTTVFLSLYAAHIFVAGPVALFVIMIFSNIERVMTSSIALTLHQLFPVIGTILLTIAVIILALNYRYPFISLIIAPLLLVPTTSVLAKPLIVGSWFTLMLIEQMLPTPVLRISLFQGGLISFFAKADIKQPQKGMLRLISLLLLMINAKVFMQSVSVEASNAAGYVFSFLTAILLAAKLLDTLRVKADYQHYLNTLAIKNSAQLASSVIYSSGYSAGLMAVVLWFDVFSYNHYTVLVAIFIATQGGILVNKRYFLLFPCIAATLLFWLM